MHLENISLVNFKNYQESHFGFCGDINGILGDNGSGKTNLLDAIYYLSLTKSFFNGSDIQSIRFGSDFFAIKGSFRKDGETFTVTCRLKNTEKKEILLEDNIYNKNTDHIGNFPVVLIAPNDTDMIRGGSELRRKFFDGILSQVDRPFLTELLKYNQALKRRNSLLKQFVEKNFFDSDLLDSYDRLILESGEKINEKRQSLIDRLLPLFEESYAAIAGKKEKVAIKYLSDWQEITFPEKFKLSRQQDLLNRRTIQGAHRDDFDFMSDQVSLRKYGSQGQQKSFLIALKLTQFELIRREKGFKPILLLDDIFDKLDDKRIQKLMNLVIRHDFGQIFITDARPERTLSIIGGIKCEKKLIYLSNNDPVLKKNKSLTKKH
jgi:DNA replication and repair protein RecF